MSSPLDLDQLQTFVAIADSGSFTRAADAVFKTQSAVSMQMKRLEDKVGKPLFQRDGRSNKLTENGEQLLIYARKLLRLNRETLAAFDDQSLEGHIRIGTPDDYAERFLPEIMARFSRSNPRVELSVVCEPSVNLDEMIKRGELDLALVTQGDKLSRSEVVRTEPLHWVTSANHSIHKENIVPLAVGRSDCWWRKEALRLLDDAGRDYRILFTSWSAMVLAASVLSGLTVSVLPDCALRPGMRILNQTDGFTSLADAHIGIMRGYTKQTAVIDALAEHISESLANISPTGQPLITAEADMIAPLKNKRLQISELIADW